MCLVATVGTGLLALLKHRSPSRRDDPRILRLGASLGLTGEDCFGPDVGADESVEDVSTRRGVDVDLPTNSDRLADQETSARRHGIDNVALDDSQATGLSDTWMATTGRRSSEAVGAADGQGSSAVARKAGRAHSRCQRGTASVWASTVSSRRFSGASTRSSVTTVWEIADVVALLPDEADQSPKTAMATSRTRCKPSSAPAQPTRCPP